MSIRRNTYYEKVRRVAPLLFPAYAGEALFPTPEQESKTAKENTPGLGISSVAGRLHPLDERPLEVYNRFV